MTDRHIAKLAKARFDLLVIGGGINGAAIANLASLNGMKVLLLEKGDFASGTSSKSTKLVHGGLRYLENLEFGLVRESLKERTIQLKSAPHLVKPLGFIIPVYKTDKRPFWMMRLGVSLYDILSGKYLIHPHRVLAAGEVMHLLPGINEEKLVGGIMYYDAQMNDARLCLENVLQAKTQGADVYNYTEVKSVLKENGKAVGVKVEDLLTGQTAEIRVKRIVSAVGPWTNIMMRKESVNSAPAVRTTKGVHIVYPGEVSAHAVFIQDQKGERMFFVIPWEGNSLIGTTDTDYTSSPDRLTVEEEDIDYLFAETRRVFPHVEFNKNDIITSFAGLRPLVFNEGAPSKVSRRHVIKETYSNMIYVYGGKYTTYRKIALDVMAKLTTKELVKTDEHYPLYGNAPFDEDRQALAKEFGVGEDVVTNLLNVYGSRCRDVLELIGKDANLKKPICGCSNTIAAQIQYSKQVELACFPEDIFIRRLSLSYHYCKEQKCLERIKSAFL